MINRLTLNPLDTIIVFKGFLVYTKLSIIIFEVII
jgi:hypothetical protein